MEERRLIKIKMIFPFLVVLYSSINCATAVDTVSANQIVRYNETIVSAQETFELGFFRPGNSMNIYVGIWYMKIQNRTVVWVANRKTPLTDNSGELTLTLDGVLILRNATNGSIVWWSVKSSTTPAKNPIGQLLDSGNFIIQEEGEGINQEDPIWQSFDFMTDTLLPGMKLGRNFVTGIERHLTSWKAKDDPALGKFSDRIDTRGYPQLIYIAVGGKIKFRGGPWNGLRFTGVPYLKHNQLYNFTFVFNPIEVYYQYNLINTSVFMNLVLRPNGHAERLLWSNSKQEWHPYTTPQNDACDDYAVCGPYASCRIENSPICECLKGFIPTSHDQWRDTDWSQGCRRRIPLNCDPEEGFNKYSNLKLPDTRESWYNQTMTLAECKKMCKNNCSCSAYTYTDISGSGTGCLLWFDGLIDIRTFADDGDTLYIRLSHSELDPIENGRRSSNGGRRSWRRVRVIVPITFVVLVMLVSICLLYRFYWKKQQQQGTLVNEAQHNPENRSGNDELELPLFGLSTILKATNNFSMNNKLGEGGYGPVYKMTAGNGLESGTRAI